MAGYIVFRLGAEEYGVDIKKVVEILKAQTPVPVPDLPEYVQGFLTIRGRIVPVIDMRKRFRKGKLPKKERIVVVKTKIGRVGLVVDEVSGIVDFKNDEISNPPKLFKGLKGEYMSGLGKKKDRVVTLLNLDGIMTEDEQLMIHDSFNKIDKGNQ